MNLKSIFEYLKQFFTNIARPKNCVKNLKNMDMHLFHNKKSEMCIRIWQHFAMSCLSTYIVKSGIQQQQQRAWVV